MNSQSENRDGNGFLEQIRGPEVGRRIDLAVGQQCTVGRSSSCEFKLDQEKYPKMSKRHFAISRDEAGVMWVADCESKHGTYLNGSTAVQSEPVQLNNGDEIHACGVVFSVSIPRTPPDATMETRPPESFSENMTGVTAGEETGERPTRAGKPETIGEKAVEAHETASDGDVGTDSLTGRTRADFQLPLDEDSGTNDAGTDAVSVSEVIKELQGENGKGETTSSQWNWTGRNVLVVVGIAALLLIAVLKIGGGDDVGTKTYAGDWFSIEVPQDARPKVQGSITLFRSAKSAPKVVALFRSSSEQDMRWTTYSQLWAEVRNEIDKFPEFSELEWNIKTGPADAPIIIRTGPSALPYVAVQSSQADEASQSGVVVGRLFLSGTTGYAIVAQTRRRSRLNAAQKTLDSLTLPRVSPEPFTRTTQLNDLPHATANAAIDDIKSLFEQRAIARANAWRAHELALALWAEIADGQVQCSRREKLTSYQLLTKTGEYINREFKALMLEMERALNRRSKRRARAVYREIELLLRDPLDWRRKYAKQALDTGGE